MSIVSRPLYRARQVLWALWPHVTDRELAEAESFLGGDLFVAFRAMDDGDKRHCIDVFNAARNAGSEDRVVLTAALIHDCGKASSREDGRIRLWHRIAYVALTTVSSGLAARMARRPGGMRLLRQHSERGIEIASAHGAPADVLELMRRMEDKGDGDARVRLLQAADDAA
jgi:hypothetical protein